MSISSTDKIADNTIFREGIQYYMFIANKKSSLDHWIYYEK